jgi:biopolymer transport protein ExbD
MAINLPDQESDELLGQINTTPLVDVMLVLLIIFLITIPVVTASVPLKLPEENNHAQTSTPQAVVISVTPTGNLFLGDAPVTSTEALRQQLAARQKDGQPVQVLIRGDAQSSFEPIGQVMQTVQGLGIENVSLLSLPRTKESRP